MREILFRGKQQDNHKWVFGCYYKQSEFYGDEMEKHIIITSHEDLSNDFSLDFCDVQSETVGQFTGLTDKNGKKIFEGDCLNHPHNVVEYLDGGFCVAGDRPLALMAKHSEVIGNIHDNPEMLEGNV